MKTICIVSPNPNKYSETFIRNHIQHIPGTILVRTRGQFPWILSFLHADRPLKKWYHLTQYRLRAYQFKRYLRSHKVDVVLAEYGHTGASITDACEQASVPMVVHFHGYDAYKYSHLAVFQSRYQKMFAQARAVIAVSRDMETHLISLGASSYKVHYNPYGVDPDMFQITNPAANEPLFVAVGRFVEKKAPYLTLLAFQKVVDVVPKARLIMIGEGELHDICKHIVCSLNLEQRVTFAGVLSHADVARVMRQARAFVQHSLRPASGDSEGTPVAILEAGMTGLPVISTCHAGIKDVVQHGKTGFLVDEGDVNGMSQSMIELARNASLAAKMGEQAHVHIRNNFSLDKSIANLSLLLERACEGV